MRKNIHIFLGWGLGLAVVVTSLFGLAKMAGATGALKEQAHWQKRAQTLDSVSAEYQQSSNLARALVDRNLGALENPYRTDREELAGLGTTILDQAKTISREKQCLAEAVYYEARSETIEGQKAVAEVVLNRVRSKHFPDTICGVVYQGAARTHGCQFSFACDGATEKLPRGKHWQEAQMIATHMMAGMSAPLTNRATHYHTTNVKPNWAKHLRQTRQYGTHMFYRFMPRKNRPASVNVAP